MGDRQRLPKAFLSEFIEIFRSETSLWKIKSSEYSDRNIKNAAYEKLLLKLKEQDPNSKKERVKTIIHSFRNSFRKELKKVKESHKSGRGTDQIYKPRLWYYDLLTFLTDQELPQSTSSNIDYKLGSDSEDSCIASSQISYEDGRRTSVASQASEKDLTKQSPNPLPSIASIPSVISQPPKAKKQRVGSPLAKQNELLSLVCKCRGISKVPEDNRPAITKVWGEKLLGLDAQQRLFAEKAINDVLFEASLQNLNIHSVKINEGPCQNSSVNNVSSTLGGMPANNAPQCSDHTNHSDAPTRLTSTAAIKKEDDQTDERDDVVSLSENDIKVELIEYGSQVADQDEGMVQPTFVPNSKRVKELADDNLNSLPVMDRTLEDPLNTTQVRLRPLDDSQVFGDFVASELRNLRSEENRRKLRRVIQQSILQISELDDFENKIMNNEPH